MSRANQMIAAHPDLADDLQAFFRNLDSIDRLAGPLNAAAVCLAQGAKLQITLRNESKWKDGNPPPCQVTARQAGPAEPAFAEPTA